MPFEMRCNMCGGTVRLEESQVGSITNCPTCGQVIFVQHTAPQGSGQESLGFSGGPVPLAGAESSNLVLDATEFLPAFASGSAASGERGPSLAEMVQPEEPPVGPGATKPEAQLGEFLGGLANEPTAAPDSAGIPILGAAGAGQATVREPLPWEVPGTNCPENDGSAALNARSGSSGGAGIALFEAAVPETPTESAAQLGPAGPVAPATAVDQSDTPDFLFAERSETSGGAFLSPGLPVESPGVAQPRKSDSQFGKLLGAYISGTIFGLILGKFIFSKPGATGLELIRDDGANKYKTQWVSPASPVPSVQRKKLGETISLGQLSVTAVSVEKKRIQLERVDPFSGNKETTQSPEPCLVLRVRLKNTSSDVEFAPLDETFLRPHEPKRRPTYSFIELAGGERINMYGLAPFSEWNIVDQPFSTIKPGEEMEAIIAAASGSAGEAKGKMLWRIQLRAGGSKGQSFSTVVGFDFTPDQIRA